LSTFEEDETVTADDSREVELPAVVEDGLAPDEEALLAAFDRMRPQGTLRWGFDDAMRRVLEPEPGTAAASMPWKGLPDDLWERGHSARIGRRFVGDVASVLAGIMATDARAVADATMAGEDDRFVATWDALRFLAARVEILEARVDPAGLEVADVQVPVPDLSEWVDRVGSWLGSPDAGATIVVGEAGDGGLVRAVAAAGWQVHGIEPRGPSVWQATASIEDDRTIAGSRCDIVLAEVADQLGAMPNGCAAGVLLAGCVDRLDLAGKLRLVDQTVRVLAPGGTVVVMTIDQAAWDGALALPARDLLPGRPLHPETWSHLLRRAGLTEPTWHRPTTGSVHAVVAGSAR
jgi:hypothetical protein